MSDFIDYCENSFLIGVVKVEEEKNNKYLVSGHLLNHSGILLSIVLVFITASCLYMFWEWILFYSKNNSALFIPSTVIITLILGFLIYKSATVDIKSGRAILMDSENKSLLFYDNWFMKTKAFEIKLKDILSLSYNEKIKDHHQQNEISTQLALKLDNQTEIILAENIQRNSDGYIALKNFLDPIII